MLYSSELKVFVEQSARCEFNKFTPPLHVVENKLVGAEVEPSWYAPFIITRDYLDKSYEDMVRHLSAEFIESVGMTSLAFEESKARYALEDVLIKEASILSTRHMIHGSKEFLFVEFVDGKLLDEEDSYKGGYSRSFVVLEKLDDVWKRQPTVAPIWAMRIGLLEEKALEEALEEGMCVYPASGFVKPVSDFFTFEGEGR